MILFFDANAMYTCFQIPHESRNANFGRYTHQYMNMKFTYRDREFWCRGHYVDIVGKNTAAVKEYIANQLSNTKRWTN